MIVNSITIEGFRTIGNKLHIDFPTDGRIGIFGHNETGKSTIFDAIEFALFGLALRTIPKEERITWGKNKLNVNLIFTLGDNQYQIDRTLTSKGAHKVKFSQLENGSTVTNSELNTITSVEETIEEILGMDKDSYSKLIYIRQKELDALKDLQKQDREKLINKLMGIDIFDDAVKDTNSDLKEEETDLDAVETKLGILKNNYDSYLKKSKEIEELEPIINKLESEVSEINIKKSALKNKLKQFEWIKEYHSQKEILDSKKLEFKSQSENLNRIKTDESNIKKYEEILDNFKPKIETLSKIHHVLESNEEEISKEKEKLESAKSQLPNSNVDRSQIMKKRSTSLKKGIGLLIVGIVLTVIGVVLLFTIILGIILVVISFVFFNRYRTFDKKLIENIDDVALMQSINSREAQITKITKRIEEIQKKCGKNSSSEIEEEIDKLSSEVNEKTGSWGIEELQGVLNNLRKNIKNSDQVTLENNVTSLNQKIKEFEENLQSLENQKPTDVNLEDSIEDFQKTQQEYDKLAKKLEKKSNELSANKATRNQLEEYCAELQKDYEEYPQLLESKEKIEEKINLLDFIIKQFKLVSEKMRSRVIPQARHEINQMLPVITGNRYSDFKITEDLKFQVYTEQVGGYKERELFSGGTQDQFLIALRLAFTKSILDSRVKADEYSLFIDEAISSSDEARKVGIFDLLDKVRSTFKQIFIIAHEDISDVVDYHLVLESGNDGYATIKSKSW